MPELLRLSLEPRVVRRALGYAVVVGGILIAINQGDRIAAGALEPGDLLKMALTACVPYCVSTLSSVAAMRDRDRSGG